MEEKYNIVFDKPSNIHVWDNACGICYYVAHRFENSIGRHDDALHYGRRAANVLYIIDWWRLGGQIQQKTADKYR